MQSRVVLLLVLALVFSPGAQHFIAPDMVLTCPQTPRVSPPPLVIFFAAEHSTEVVRQSVKRAVVSAIDSAFECCCMLEVAGAQSRIRGAARSDASRGKPSHQTALLLRFLDSVRAGNLIDADRIFVAGFSSDTAGVWDLLQRRPDMFAAAVPIGRGGDRRTAYRLVKTPIWSHHGSVDMVKAIVGAGGGPRFTPGGALRPLVDTVGLGVELRWMLSHARTADQIAYCRFLSEQENIAPVTSPSLPDRERFHLYLLIGQSNMAGRGRVEEDDRRCHPRAVVFTKDNTWSHAAEPLHFDRPAAGVGPGLSFGKHLARDDDSVTIGLIPCAVGETTIDDWQRDSRRIEGRDNLYRNAVIRARRAMEQGTLKAILWHQGESNNYSGGLAYYEERLRTFIEEIRKDLNAPELPFILGEIARSRGEAPVNRIIARIIHTVPNTALVSSEGLKTEGLHFDTPSYRELGRRYAEAVLSRQTETREAAWSTKEK